MERSRDRSAVSARACVRADGAHVVREEHGGAARARRVAREELPWEETCREDGRQVARSHASVDEARGLDISSFRWLCAFVTC